MPSILNHDQPADDGNPPLPPPNWALIDAVAATLGRPPTSGLPPRTVPGDRPPALRRARQAV